MGCPAQVGVKEHTGKSGRCYDYGSGLLMSVGLAQDAQIWRCVRDVAWALGPVVSLRDERLML